MEQDRSPLGLTPRNSYEVRNEAEHFKDIPDPKLLKRCSASPLTTHFSTASTRRGSSRRASALSVRIVPSSLWITDFYLRAIEPLIAIVLGCMHRKNAQALKCDIEKDDNRTANKTKRRQQCTPKVLDMARPGDARSVMVSLASSGTTRGELRFVPRSASIASERAGKVTAPGCPGSKSPWNGCQRTTRGRYDVPDLTTRQGIFGNSTDCAARGSNHDRRSHCGSA